MWVPSVDPYSLLSWLVALAAALTGGVHCLVMCGPLRLLSGEGARSRWRYQGGRLAAYLALGASGGLVGYALPWWVWLPIGLLLVASGSLGLLTAAPRWWRHPFLAGAATALLPCGLLHGWLVVAAATGNPASGAALLGVLWLGSLPFLELPLGLGWLRALKGRFPRAMPFVFLALAVLPLLLRKPHATAAGAGGEMKAPVCHGQALPGPIGTR